MEKILQPFGEMEDRAGHSYAEYNVGITIEYEKGKDMEMIFIDAVKMMKRLNKERKLEGIVKYG